MSLFKANKSADGVEWGGKLQTAEGVEWGGKRHDEAEGVEWGGR